MEVLSAERIKEKSIENPTAIHLKGNEDAKSPSSHEDATHETKNDDPIVHPDGQTSKSEPQSPDWLPKGWRTETRVRKRGKSAGNKDKYYHDPITKRQFRSKKKVFHFLKKWEWSKGTPKEKLEGEFGVETKSLSRITPHFYSSMDTIIHHSGYVNNVSIPTGTPILGFHDPVVLQNTVDPYTYKRQLTRNFDVLVDNNHVAPFLSHPSPMVATIPELRSVNNLGIPTTTPVPRFYDSASSESTLRSDAISRQLIGSSNVPFQNKHVAPLHPYAPPMFGFNPELGVVNSVRIATATHISHIYHSAPSQSAINPDTITPPMFGFTPQLGVVNNVIIPTATPISHMYHSAPSQSAINPDTIWRSTKFQRVSNNLQGSWAPRFSEEKKQWVSNNLKGSWSPRFIEEKKQW